jgi:hypothetical protein
MPFLSILFLDLSHLQCPRPGERNSIQWTKFMLFIDFFVAQRAN